MIIVVLKDGLGNQLFQYAAAKCIATKLNTQLKLDIASFGKNPVREYSLHHFDINEEFASSFEKISLRLKNIYSRLVNKVGFRVREYRYFEKVLGFNPSFFQIKDNTYIEGYWQSENFFLPIADILRKEFMVKAAPDKKNAAYLNEMKGVNSVSLHIRRGDYVTNKLVNSIHGLCTTEYYQQAVEFIRRNIPDPVFFIFSDDMDWVKANFIIKNNSVHYMDHNENKDYEDLRLMYSCKHNIIANSSFSWWGGWLNNNPNKIVIAPANWFKSHFINADIVPATWKLL